MSAIKIGNVKYPRSVWDEMQRDAAPDKKEQEQMRRDFEKEIGRTLICAWCGSPLEIDPDCKHDLHCSRLCGFWVIFFEREYAEKVLQGLRGLEGV